MRFLCTNVKFLALLESLRGRSGATNKTLPLMTLMKLIHADRLH